MSGARALMLLGTGSDVGKSVIAAAFCRILARERLSGGPVQSPEHGAQFVHHAGRRRDGPRAGGPGRSSRNRPARRYEPHPAQTHLQHGLTGDRARKGGREFFGHGILRLQKGTRFDGARQLRAAQFEKRHHRYRGGGKRRRTEPQAARSRQHGDGRDGRRPVHTGRGHRSGRDIRRAARELLADGAGRAGAYNRVHSKQASGRPEAFHGRGRHHRIKVRPPGIRRRAVV